MYTLKLYRLVKTKPKIIRANRKFLLESRDVTDDQMDWYFRNGNISYIFAYVEQFYGGSEYQIKLYHDSNHVGEKIFIITGQSKV